MMLENNAKVLTNHVKDDSYDECYSILQYAIYDSENDSEAVVRYDYETRIVEIDVKYFNNPTFGRYNCSQSVDVEVLDSLNFILFFDELKDAANKQLNAINETKKLIEEYPHLKPIKRNGLADREFTKNTAKNVKAYLQHLFPDYKFSVTCDFGGIGDRINVSYKSDEYNTAIHRAADIFQECTSEFNQCFGYVYVICCSRN